MIVMDEYAWAEKAIASRDLGASPVETLSVVSRYYRSQQYDQKETRALLDAFMIQCDPQVSLVQWADTLDRLVKKSGKRPLVKIDSIPVTEGELRVIRSLEGVQIQRLAFTLLCVSKYWDIANTENSHWVNTPDRELMRMANISTSVRRQSMMFSQLRELGLIKFSKKIDVLNVQVTFGEELGTVAMEITDFRNLGFQYMMQYFPGYYVCENCGITVKQPEGHKGRPRKYCIPCAQEVRTQQNVNAVMRYRSKVVQ